MRVLGVMLAVVACAALGGACGLNVDGSGRAPAADDAGPADAFTSNPDAAGSASNSSGSGSSGGAASSSSSSSGTSSSSSGGPGSSTGSSSGGSSGSSGSSGGSSGSGSGSGSSSGGLAGCPYVACASNEVCCADPSTQAVACATSCISADTVHCLKPHDCTVGTGCCGTLLLNGSCSPQSVSTQCVAGCATNLDFGDCPSTSQLHFCAQVSDCTGDSNNPNCCNLQGYFVCVDNDTAGNLTCL